MTDKTDDIEPSIGQVLMELAGEVRRAMLFALSTRRLKLTDLAGELDITVQHAHININRLIDIKLVEKTSDGSLGLTAYGKMMLKQLSSFKFLASHMDYFQDHTFGGLPLKFEQRIGALDESSVVKGVVAVFQRWKFMYQEAEKYINSITSQVLVDLIEPLAKKVRSGTKLKYILPEDVVLPKGTLAVTKKLSWRSLLAEGKAERRMVEKVPVATIVTDKSACVLFPNLKNEIDMNVMFYSEDAIFHEWCQEYFIYMWNSSDIFDERKLQPEI